MNEVVAQIEKTAELFGPNFYVQAAFITLAFVLFGKIAEWMLSRIIGRIARRSSTELDDKLVDLLRRPIFISFVLIGLGIATQRVALSAAATFVTVGALKTIAIFLWYNFFRGLADLGIRAARDRQQRNLEESGMLQLLRNVIKVVMFALFVYFLFLAWRIDLTAWIASAGIIGLALSFAAKDTLSNLFAGVSIVADAPYKTGDFIILDTGERGLVTHIGLRSTRLLTRDDVEITIPNGVIGNSKIINEAGGPSPRHRIRVAVGVAYGSDIDQVTACLERIAADHTGVCAEPAPRVRFRRFGESSLDFELLCWIDRPVDRGRLGHELHCAVYKAFAAEGIVIPFPQRDLNVRNMPPAGNV